MSVTVTSKGRVTIPKKVREHLGIEPGTVVDFLSAPDGRVMLVVEGRGVSTQGRKRNRFAARRGSATVKMSTREIMALTRGED